MLDHVFPLYGACSLLVLAWLAGAATQPAIAELIAALAFWLGWICAEV
jgi:hypothetical protein